MNGTTPNCPKSEELGAFIDGRLQGKARRAVLAHLETCPACHEEFTDIIRSLDEMGERGGEISRPWFRNPRGKLAYAIYGTLAAAAMVLVFFGLGLLKFRDSDWDTGGWWRERYPSWPGPLSERAQKVFDRLRAAAELDSGLNLWVLETEAGPFALATREGVVLSHRGLALCYEDVPEDQGDRRLAFVLGHELTHFLQGEFFHAFAAFSSQRQGVAALEDREGDPRDREHRADRRGLFFASLAGYDPSRFLDREGSFFEQWAAQPTAAVDDSHPDPQRRAGALIGELEKFAAELAYFEFAVAMYDLGRLPESQALFERFARFFPAREASNNLGLVHFQRSARILAQCDGDLAMRFQWPVAVDRETLISRAMIRGRDPHPCLEEEPFREQVGMSLSHFEDALRKDPAYLPARLNRLATLLLGGENAEAMIGAEDLIAEGILDHRLTHIHALAGYLYAKERGLPPDADIERLRQLRQDRPNDAALTYNLAMVFKETGRHEEAETQGKAFLELETRGPHAAYMRDWLGIPAPDFKRPATPPSSPVPLGAIGEETRALLDRLHPLGPETSAGVIYRSPEVAVLVRQNTVAMVRAPAVDGFNLEEIETTQGPPIRRAATVSGETRYYQDFATEIGDGKVSGLWFYHRQ